MSDNDNMKVSNDNGTKIEEKIKKKKEKKPTALINRASRQKKEGN